MPMPLEDGLVHANLGDPGNPAGARLDPDADEARRGATRRASSGSTSTGTAAAERGNSFYAFADLNFMQADSEVMNWWTSHSPGFYQTRTVVLIKFLRRPRRGVGGEQEEVEEVYGKRMLINGIMKGNLGGKTEVVMECKSERERVEVLERYFGISLTDQERVGMRGWATELRGE